MLRTAFLVHLPVKEPPFWVEPTVILGTVLLAGVLIMASELALGVTMEI